MEVRGERLAVQKLMESLGKAGGDWPDTTS